jgi:hypothetical protein
MAMVGTGMGLFEGGKVINIGGLLGRILDQEGDVVMERRMDPHGVLSTAGFEMQGHSLCSEYY